MDIITNATLTGFIGDASLQLLTSKGLGGPTGWGLNSYFSQHGPIESLFIAAGMMAVFYIVYMYILKLPLKPTYLAVYGIVLDYLFRRFRLFPSLDGYYHHLNYIESAIWGAIPMVIPFFMYQL
jgi:hypothetical protein